MGRASIAYTNKDYESLRRELLARVPQLTDRWTDFNASDLGVVLLWNSESALPSGLLPTILDSALGLTDGTWLDDDIDIAAPSETLYATEPAKTPAGVDSSAATASPF